MKELTWQAPEYAYEPKSSDWYWTVGIITAALTVTSFIFGDGLFGIVIAVGVFALTMLVSRKPNTVAVRLAEKGVEIDRTLYLFESMDSFSVDTRSRHAPRIVFVSKKLISPPMTVPAPNDAAEIEGLRAFLGERVQEKEFRPGLIQTLLERMGF